MSGGTEERRSGGEAPIPSAPLPLGSSALDRGRLPRIGIDARKLKDYGIGSYVRNLLEAVGRHPDSSGYRFRIYARRSDEAELPALPGNFEIAYDDSPGYSFSELIRLPWRLLRDRLDLFHATHYVLPPLPKTRAVVTIHDIIHLLYPQFLPNRAALFYARYMIRRALTRADRIITVSHNTRSDLVNYFRVPASRIEVIYNGVSPRFTPDIPEDEQARVGARLNIRGPYMLFLGGEKPHKNVQNVIRAFAKAKRENSLPHVLVLAGPMPSKPARMDALIAALEMNDSVIRTGIIEDEDLPALYAGAEAFLYPTLYEGFGLPVVEAMASGTPVLTSSTSALQEIAGGFALLVNPMDVDAIADGIVKLATDERARGQYAALGRKRALDFSWDRAAARTLQVYADTLRVGRREAGGGRRMP
jgi:glycosyltransferase involved in cell wall biosynthesis